MENGERVFVEVGASLNGVSFGRVATTDSIDYTAVTQTTFGVSSPSTVIQFRTGTGAVNAASVVGPVIVNEIFYNPPAGGSEEYIELHNNSGSPVTLFDALNPTNHWSLGGGIDYTFQAGASLGAGAYLLVVDFDPVLEPATLTTFRAHYGISTNIAVHGPFLGSLNNGGDVVELYRPDSPQGPGPDEGFVPYVLADRVAYHNAAPWPTGPVTGRGHALMRTAPILYGNEPLNWFGGTPTPGAENRVSTIDTDGDGIPDHAEDAMGLNKNNPADGALDPDEDGASDYAEWVAGTNHRDPASYLRLIGIAVGACTQLTFDAVAAKTYSVLYKDAMVDTTWSKLTDVSAAGVNTPQKVVDSRVNPQRFYILATPQTTP